MENFKFLKTSIFIDFSFENTEKLLSKFQSFNLFLILQIVLPHTEEKTYLSLETFHEFSRFVNLESNLILDFPSPMKHNLTFLHALFTHRRRSYPLKSETDKPIRFAVRSLGWVEIAEEDLTPERSSKAVNKCILDLSFGKNDLLDVVGRWGDVSFALCNCCKRFCF